jgi:hypothetical protein
MMAEITRRARAVPATSSRCVLADYRRKRLMDIALVPMPPAREELTVYQVLDDLGDLGPMWREIAEASANEQAIVDDILSGQYVRPLRVVAFNTDDGWARDVTGEIAAKLLDAAGTQGRSLGAAAWEFIERATAAASH